MSANPTVSPAPVAATRRAQDATPPAAELAWAQGPADPSLIRDELLHELFEFQADRSGERTAVVCAGAALTYAELDRAANRLAHFLRDRGVGRGDCVALLLPRSLDAYVAILAVLKAGAAYVPLDPEYPDERVAYILADCRARVLLTTGERAGFVGDVVCVDKERAAIEASSCERLPALVIATRPDDLCYVIYTSGTTGRPKGVQIEHRSACHLVRAEGKLFQVRPDDRVFQGFSLAFDASVEEVWLAFFAGATLVVGTRDVVHSGPRLPRLLAEAGVTVLSCVPTLLAMMDEDVPGVRLLILGGEACPPEIVSRWARPGRRLVNSYGPTEATVIATLTDCVPGRPVTIGRPLPNYVCYLLDEELRPVPPGEAGELYLGGVGLARGYVGLPELTAARFVANPFSEGGRLYRTGDLGRWTAGGEIEFLGRADTQVKLRGYRIELAEIESVLLAAAGVRAAAVTVREPTPGVQQLVAYVVPRAERALDRETIRTHLRANLPAYMVPALLEEIPDLPTLPSGKVDRHRLPAPQPQAPAQHAQPRNEAERVLLRCWERLFAPLPVALDHDFFLDLGGHSLLAARMVSELRKQPAFHELSVSDVYSYPTIEALAARAASVRPRLPQPVRERHRPSSWAHFLCGVAQLIALYPVMGLFSLQWLAPYLTYSWLIDDEYSVMEAVLGSLASLLLVYPMLLIVAVAVKWLVIGRYRAGRYPLWGTYYFRWWFVNAVQGIVPIDYLAGTPLLNWLYRALGASVGRDVHLGSHAGCVYDLLSVGDRTCVGSDTSLAGYTVEDGWLILGPIAVGRDCFIGSRSVLRERTRLEDGAWLEDLSLLPPGGVVPQGERWSGSPARPAAKAGDVEIKPAPAGRLRGFLYGVLYAAGVLVVPVFVLAAIFPGMMWMNYLNIEDDYYWYLFVSPAVALSFVVFLCLEIAVMKWLLLGRVRPGRHALYSSFVARKWFVDRLLDLSLDVIGTLYATIYLAPWYRLLGARLGKRTEISTASYLSPDLLTIEDEGFLADAVSLGAARVEGGWVSVAETHIGRRSFVGNSALLPPGTRVGDDCLIGCLSRPPDAGVCADGTSWLGSPAFFLPVRQQSRAFAAETTFRPTLALLLQRGFIEFFRVILPGTCFVALISLLLSVVILIRDEISFLSLVWLFPVLYACCGVAATLFVVALKWLLMGKYRAGEHPLWSTFVWRTELVTALHDNLADLFLTGMLHGTPLLPWYLRLLGAKIGRRAYLETAEFAEFDLVTLGDDVCLNEDATIQTHLFEDRVMKLSHVTVGDRCTVGGASLVLYDTMLEDDAVLGDLSLLMKGETLPAGTRWAGVPARAEEAADAAR